VIGFWTVVTVTTHLASLGLQLSRATLRRLLHDLDYRWRRPRHELLNLLMGEWLYAVQPRRCAVKFIAVSYNTLLTGRRRLNDELSALCGKYGHQQ
jgi:hypothetical protein